MAFLSKNELKSVIRENKVTHISDHDDTIVEIAINAGITEVTSRIAPNHKKAWMDGRLKYDVAAIFKAEGSTRNPLILELTKVVALWHLILRCNAGIHYEVIRDRYEAAVEYLKDLASGDANDPTLPILEEPLDEHGNPINAAKPFSTGSRPKFNHEF
ncbi:hypothetical protein [Sphingobacterium psychroaquaticum]|uniref:Mu-like prophage protein gp36 n=1 Tax=Sphingobacterium psychroaquaticum TaxID=561061 RepID=A0A1X7K5Q1_9SPHI|nr:hypothetical protein [Sphingobacterium psychroaquaticum]SMG35548.1 hypothetical protein SAMN05660862_2530 [Sphingobacterium psychroaquaticum]